MNVAERPRVIDLALAAVPYSSNLGDGIIHDVMLRILQDDGVPASVATLDLAGRTRYAGLDQGERNKRKRSLIIINALPAFLRRAAVMVYALALYWRKSRAQYAAALHGADHVIIGGGHLFSDLDLNFPAKLYCVHLSLRRFAVPFSIYGVGASDNWSPAGRWLFRKLLRSPLLKGITVRDAYSRDVVTRELRALGRSLPVTHVWDPAVATALYHREARPTAHTGPRQHIGVNVADLALLANAGDRATGIDEGLTFFQLLLARLQEQYRVTVFTNGAEEDENFLTRLCAQPGLRCQRAERPLTPGDLIALIRQFDGVVSHRLHAHIVCFSYGIPSVGLGWDTKVASFFARVGRAQFLVDGDGDTAAADIVARVCDLLAATPGTTAASPQTAALEARQQLQDFFRTVVNA